MAVNIDKIKKMLFSAGISADDNIYVSLETIANELQKANKIHNLTAVDDEDGIIIKHFLDSLAVMKFDLIPQDSKIIDIGTGAGFPGLPLTVCRPDINMTMVDSTDKKITYINSVLDKLQSVTNKCNAVTARAEELGRINEYREKFDCAVSRAVAKLSVLCELCIPFVKTGGAFIAFKGAYPAEEIAEAMPFIIKNGCNIEEIIKYNLSVSGFENVIFARDKGFTSADLIDNARTLILIRKNAELSVKYPRNYSQILKNPVK